MKRTVLAVAVTAVVVAAAAFGVGRASSGDSKNPARSVAVVGGEDGATSDGHDDVAPSELIAGAGHVHAVAHLPGGQLLLGSHGGLFRSDDGGRSWDKVGATGDLQGTDFMSLVPHPTRPEVVFAGGHGLGVVKSTDGGDSWERSDEGIDGTDIHALAINQRQPDYVFAYSAGHGVYRSSDGGESWDRLDDGPDNPGVRSFAYMAVQTDMDRSMGSDNWGLLFAGTADGIFDSYSCFCGWRETTDQFDGSTVYSLSTAHQDLQTMYAGTTNGVWKSTDEGKTWRHLDGVTGRVAAVAIDSADPETVVAVTEAGEVFASTDGGAQWDTRNRDRADG